MCALDDPSSTPTVAKESTEPRHSSRRTFLRTSAGIVGAAALAGSIGLPATAAGANPSAPMNPADEGGDRIIMLGVNAGPLLLGPHYQPAIALIVGGSTYLIDCGADTARQMTRANLGFAPLQHVFLTHRHPDHTAGLPALRLLGWTYTPSPLSSLTVWGPPETHDAVREIDDAFEQETRLFESIGFPRIAVHGNTLTYGPHRHGIYRVMEDERVIVDLTRVFHGPEVRYAYAYRFTIKSSGKKIVFSGDTVAPDANLIHLAADADFLVHEVMDVAAIDLILATTPPAQRAALRAHLLNSHSDVRLVPAVAKAANVKNLVMCHYTGPVPVTTFLALAQAAAAIDGYTGSITAPTDLDVIPI